MHERRDAGQQPVEHRAERVEITARVDPGSGAAGLLRRAVGQPLEVVEARFTIVNSGTADGSLVKSAIFLQEFVTKPWVHLDIAGTAYLRKAYPWAARGATGVSHATLVELALAGATQG